MKLAGRDETVFRIVVAIIHDRRRQARKHFAGKREIQASFGEGPVAFDRIEGDLDAN